MIVSRTSRPGVSALFRPPGAGGMTMVALGLCWRMDPVHSPRPSKNSKEKID